jgi:hypothetical protein
MQAKVQEMRHPMAPAQKQRIARDILAARVSLAHDGCPSGASLTRLLLGL